MKKVTLTAAEVSTLYNLMVIMKAPVYTVIQDFSSGIGESTTVVFSGDTLKGKKVTLKQDITDYSKW